MEMSTLISIRKWISQRKLNLPRQSAIVSKLGIPICNSKVREKLRKEKKKMGKQQIQSVMILKETQWIHLSKKSIWSVRFARTVLGIRLLIFFFCCCFRKVAFENLIGIIFKTLGSIKKTFKCYIRHFLGFFFDISLTLSTSSIVGPPVLAGLINSALSVRLSVCNAFLSALLVHYFFSDFLRDIRVQ